MNTESTALSGQRRGKGEREREGERESGEQT